MTNQQADERIWEALIAAFCEDRRVTDDRDKRFGSVNLGHIGISDGSKGVQWNAWFDWRWANAPTGYVGVNLEGLTYDNWPIGRLIERELRAPELPSVIGQVLEPSRVELLWFRDAWQFASRPIIKEKLIGGSPIALDGLTPDGWRVMLREAGECLGSGFERRARQVVTPKSGPKEFDVSPHLQFRVACWPQAPYSITSWQSELGKVFDLLSPLHDFATRRAAK